MSGTIGDIVRRQASRPELQSGGERRDSTGYDGLFATVWFSVSGRHNSDIMHGNRCRAKDGFVLHDSDRCTGIDGPCTSTCATDVRLLRLCRRHFERKWSMPECRVLGQHEQAIAFDVKDPTG